MFLRSAIEEINGFRFMIDKLEIQSGLAKRILNTLPYLHTPETIAQELDKTEVMRNILQTSELTDTITKIKVKLMQVKDIRGTANRVTESQILDDIELFELKAFSLLAMEIRELLLSANITVVSLPDLEPVVNILDPEKMRIPHFYVYDAYSPELAALRAKMKTLKMDEKTEERVLDQLQFEHTELEDRIREKLSEQIHPYKKEINEALVNTATLDILLAKAQQTIDMQLCKPEISTSTTRYIKIFNPQVKEVLWQEGKKFQAINRPKDNDEFMKGNFGFASALLDTLKKYHNTCPVMLSSSAQASLTGRFGNSEYGRSKKAGEDLFLQYGKETGAKVLVYRFPNLYGKWCRPNYNSAVATFCNNIANDLPIQVNDPSVELELLYIDDLVDEMIHALKGEEHHCEFEGLDVHPEADGRYCYCPVTHKVTLGEIVDLLHQFAEMPKTLMIPEIPVDSFAKRLYSTFLSYLPKEKAIFDLKMNVDQRGSFTELVHTLNCGQVSINISKPGVTKGEHWHNTKWEQFIVVSGHGLIQLRKEGTDEIWNYEVNGNRIQAVHILPGYTHNIINLSETEDLVTVMYCNEVFNPDSADTYFDPVEKK